MLQRQIRFLARDSQIPLLRRVGNDDGERTKCNVQTVMSEGEKAQNVFPWIRYGDDDDRRYKRDMERRRRRRQLSSALAERTTDWLAEEGFFLCTTSQLVFSKYTHLYIGSVTGYQKDFLLADLARQREGWRWIDRVPEENRIFTAEKWLGCST